MKKEIVILANSLKNQARCVAGKCTSTKQWIRPVGDAQGKALTNSQITVKNWKGQIWQLKTLQKAEISFSAHAPLVNQPENYLIDGSQWLDKFRIQTRELLSFLDYPNDLWGNGDRVNFYLIQFNKIINNSLYLIHVNDLRLYTQYNKRRGTFIYNHTSYNFACTDPNFDNILQNRSHIDIKSAILCISLGEPWNGDCYKLIAAIYLL